MRLVIIVPAFNEAKTIQKIILDCLAYGDVIVVNDNSNDETQKIAERYATLVINHKKNLGYDCAIETGILEAISKNYDYVLTIDADGEHSTNKIDEIKKLCERGYDLIIGNRSTKNRFIEIIYAYYAKLFWNINDPMCGMKIYNIDMLKRIKPLNSYNSIGTEIMFRFIKSGARYISFDIQVSKRVGKSRMGASLKVNLIILKSIFRSFFI